MRVISRRPQLPGRRAFTLVELLVVVAIIALLVSILLPSLGRAKGSSRRMKCMTNMYAIGRAAWFYAAENNYYVPRGAANSCNTPGHANFGCYQFAVKFSPYVGGPTIPYEYDDAWFRQHEFFKEIDVYKCPSFQDQEYALTYIVNARNFDYPPGYTEACATKLTNLPRAAAEIAYIVGLNPANPSLCPTGCYGAYDVWDNGSGGWYGPQLTFSNDGDPNPEPRMVRYDDERHAGKVTLVFFDGHAESRNLIPEEIPVELFFPDGN